MATAKKIAVSLTAIIVLVLFGVGIKTASLSTGDGAGGWLWSSNVGWTKMNNCTDPRDKSTCTGSDFGVSFLPIAPGVGSGYAWSSTLGWITFNDAGCPANVLGCTGGAHIDWKNPNANDTVNVYGWARACSVYASGCSGPLADDALRGGWDGYIALSDPLLSRDGSKKFGITLNPFTGQFSGFGWGSDIIGWVSFANAILPPPPPTTPLAALVADPSEVLSGGASILTVTAENFATSVSCTIDHGIGTVAMTSAGRDGWTGTANATNITSATTYTVTCTGPSGSASDIAKVTVRTGDGGDGGGGNGGGGGGNGDGGGDGGPGSGDNKTPKKIWYIEI